MKSMTLLLVRLTWKILGLFGFCIFLCSGCDESEDKERDKEPVLGSYNITVSPEFVFVRVDPNNLPVDPITRILNVSGTCVPYGETDSMVCTTFEPIWKGHWVGISKSIFSVTPLGTGNNVAVEVSINAWEASKYASKDSSLVVKKSMESYLHIMPSNLPKGFKTSNQKDFRVRVIITILPVDSESTSTISDLELSSSVGAIPFSPTRSSVNVRYFNNGTTTAIVQEPYIIGIDADRFTLSGAKTGRFAPGLYKGLTVTQEMVPKNNQVYTAELVIPYNDGNTLRIPITSQR